MPPHSHATRSQRKSPDTQRNLRLYYASLAFEQGHLPSNAQISACIDYCLENGLAPDSVWGSLLSEEGTKVVGELRDVLGVVSDILKTKNHDEIFQRFLFEVWETVKSTNINLTELNGAQIKPPQLNNDARQIAVYLRKLVEVLWASTEANKLLKYTTLVLRDVLADAVLYTAEEVIRPSTEELKAVDEAPEMPTPPKSSKSSSRVREESNEQKQIVQQLKKTVPARIQASFEASWSEIKSFLDSRVPESRMRVLPIKLKKILVESQRSDDYQETMEFLLSRLEEYNNHLLNITSQVREKNRESVEVVQVVEKDFQTILERFANDRSMDPVFEAVKRIYEDVRDDQALRDWFNSISDWAKRVLREPGYFTSNACDADRKQILDAGQVFWQANTGKYTAQKDEVLNGIHAFLIGFTEDPLNKKLANAIQSLFQSAASVDEGKFLFNVKLLKDLKNVVISEIVNSIGWIPVPRVEYADGEYEIVLEDLAVDASCLSPIEVKILTSTAINIGKPTNPKRRHSLSVSFSHLHIDLQDVIFYFHKKTGLIQFSDTGLVDVQVGGRGIYGTVVLDSLTSGDQADEPYTIKKIQVKIDQVDLNFRSSTHSVITTLLKPFIARAIKNELSKAMTNHVRSALVDFNVRSARALRRVGSEASEVEAWSLVKDFVAELVKGKKEVGGVQTVAVSITKEPKLVHWTSSEAPQRVEEEHEPGWQSKAFDVLVDQTSSVA